MNRFKTPAIKLKTAHEIHFSPTEDRVVYFGDRNVTTLNLATRKPLFSKHIISHPDAADFSPDGKRIAVKNTAGLTIVVNSSTGSILSDFHNKKEGEGSAALFSPCGNYIVSVSWDGLLSVRHWATGEILLSEIHKGSMLNHLSTPANRSFFIFTEGRPPKSDSTPPPPDKVLLYSWPIHSAESRELPKRWSFIEEMKISPTGRLLAVAYGADKRRLDIYDLKLERVVASQNMKGIGSIGWSNDERTLAVSGDDQCSILEVPGLTVKSTFPLRYACHASFSPSSRHLAFGSWQNSFVVPVDFLPQFTKSMHVGDA